MTVYRKKTTHTSKNIHGIPVLVVLTVGTARVSFEYLSVIITKTWWPFVVLSSDPRINISTIGNCLYNGNFTGKTSGGVRFRIWHNSQSLTVPYLSIAIHGQ